MTPVKKSGSLLAKIVGSIPATVDAAHIRETVAGYYASYGSGDLDGREALFTDDLVFEDPAGRLVATNKSSLHEFFEQMVRPDWSISFRPERVTVVGNEAIAVSTMTFVLGERIPTYIVILAHFVFADDGRITAMRAFFDESGMTDTDPGPN